ncbi:hypothetical protein BaRGS_00037238 [Batillaria attramentaria]|uniref:Uncharacterized protein n=1 Tax=Batillaria attramentaria TaxID=370345 RepID=A0ABD0J9L6_9CAEN
MVLGRLISSEAARCRLTSFQSCAALKLTRGRCHLPAPQGMPPSSRLGADAIYAHPSVCRSQADSGPMPSMHTQTYAALKPTLGRCHLCTPKRMPLSSRVWADAIYAHPSVCRSQADSGPMPSMHTQTYAALKPTRPNILILVHCINLYSA